MITDTGLAYVGTVESRHTRTSRGVIVQGATSPVLLAENDIRSKSTRLSDGLVSERLASKLGARRGVASDMSGGTPSFRPSINGGKQIEIGTIDGKHFTRQVPGNSNVSASQGFSILEVDGRPFAIESVLWTGSGSGARPVHSTTTDLDSAGRPRSIVDIDYDEPAQTSFLTRVRTGAQLVGDALFAVVAPDALHAATVDEYEAIPCKSELDTLVAATAAGLATLAAAGAADAALAAAVATCASTPLDPPGIAACVMIPGLTGQAQAANAMHALAVGYAIMKAVELNTCYRKYKAVQDSIRRANTPPEGGPSDGGGSGGGSGTGQCPDINWYVSFDDGLTWHYLGTEPGGYTCGGQQYAT